jgi:hypothetical protein
MKDIILISKQDIVIHIVSLIAKKNHLEFVSIPSLNDKVEKSKLIIIDEEENFSNALYDFSKHIVLLTNQNITDISKYALIIKKPFLPISCEKSLLNILSNIEKNINTNINDKNIIDEDKADDLVDFLDNLDESNKEEDEVLISKDSLKNGGILDKEELNKLNDILNDEIKTITPTNENETNLDDLSSIIDNAIEELNEEDNHMNNDEYKLILNNFTMQELKPLLTKLNQNIIDQLVDGQEIKLILKVKNG